MMAGFSYENIEHLLAFQFLLFSKLCWCLHFFLYLNFLLFFMFDSIRKIPMENQFGFRKWKTNLDSEKGYLRIWQFWNRLIGLVMHLKLVSYQRCVFGYDKSVQYGGPLRTYSNSWLDWGQGLKPETVFIVSTQ